jgi:cytochrome c oxidase assembly protein subunit 15
VATAFATLLLIVAGGLVTSTESGLSVPDWPTTYGENPFTFPLSKWVGGIRFEHSHRLIASAVGLLTVVLAVWLQRKEPRRWVRALGWAAVAAVVAQGVLGGLTVLFLLPTPISVAHACLAQIFFCLTVGLAVVTAPRWRDGSPAASLRVTRLAGAAAAVVFLQLLVGSVMRHTKAGLAIPDFPLALGRVVPPLDSFPVAIAFAHRVLALVVFGFVCAAAAAAVASGRNGLRRTGWILLLLVVGQISLGAWTVLSGKAVAVTTAHVATGAAILGVSIALCLSSLRCDRAAAVARDRRPEVLKPELPGVGGCWGTACK